MLKMNSADNVNTPWIVRPGAPVSIRLVSGSSVGITMPLFYRQTDRFLGNAFMLGYGRSL